MGQKREPERAGPPRQSEAAEFDVSPATQIAVCGRFLVLFRLACANIPPPLPPRLHKALYFKITATTTDPQPDGYRRRLYGGGGGDGGVMLMLLYLLVMLFAAWGFAHGALLLLVSCPSQVLKVSVPSLPFFSLEFLDLPQTAGSYPPPVVGGPQQLGQAAWFV